MADTDKQSLLYKQKLFKKQLADLNLDDRNYDKQYSLISGSLKKINDQLTALDKQSSTASTQNTKPSVNGSSKTNGGKLPKSSSASQKQKNVNTLISGGSNPFSEH